MDTPEKICHHFAKGDNFCRCCLWYLKPSKMGATLKKKGANLSFNSSPHREGRQISPYKSYFPSKHIYFPEQEQRSRSICNSDQGHHLLPVMKCPDDQVVSIPNLGLWGSSLQKTFHCHPSSSWDDLNNVERDLTLVLLNKLRCHNHF